jgi:hypothetical protein
MPTLAETKQRKSAKKLYPANSRRSVIDNSHTLKPLGLHTKKTLKVIKLKVAKQSKPNKKSDIKMDNYKIYQKMTAREDDTLKSKTQKKTRQCMCINYKVMDADATDLMDKNIEITRCQSAAEPGTDFCSKHQTCPNIFKKYQTGAEPPVADDNWNQKFVKASHNCYAYFLDDQKISLADKCQNICQTKRNGANSCPEKNDDCRPLIPQPGDAGDLYATNQNKNSATDCGTLTQKILKDNPNIKPALFTERCPNNYYKGAVVVSPEKSFHFYRQNKDGRWSHKPGVLPVSHTDAADHQIWVPHFADRNYLENPLYGTTYSQFCSYYCIPNNQYIKTNSA